MASLVLQVQEWLEGVLGDRSVPAYELNSCTLDSLADIMARNQQAETRTQLLIEDYRQKADEYSAESMVAKQ